MKLDIAGKRIVLIGGAGFIGHNLALELRRRGAEVSVIDGLQVNNLLSLHCQTSSNVDRDLYLSIVNERIELLRAAGVPLYVEDARDYLRLNLILGDLKPEVVVLLAAVAHASRSNKDPFHTFDHSFRTLENALDSARSGVKHFIYFSSSMVYGNFEGAAVTEESPCNPMGIYGALKFGGEKLVIAYNQVFELAVHHRPAVGAVRRALHQPPCRPGVHRERAARPGSRHQRRRRRVPRFHLHRRPGGRRLPLHRQPGGREPDLQPDLRAGTVAERNGRHHSAGISRDRSEARRRATP